jgi:hypothetical protein
MALVGPITETLEQLWISRRTSYHLKQMRAHMKFGHRWHATRGQWEVS